jgi:hypothetical protein
MLDIVSQKQLVSLPTSFYATRGLPEKTSDKYAAIPTYRVVHALEKDGFEVVNASQKSVRKAENSGYQLHVARLRHVSLTGNNLLVPEIGLLNSSNATSGFKLISGASVFLCANGLCFAEKNMGSFTVSHRGEQLLERVLLAARAIMQHAKEQAELLTTWQGVHMTYSRQLDFAYHARALRFSPIKQEDGRELWPIEAGDLLQARRFAERADNLYNVFNRVQEHLVRGGLQALGQNNRTRATRAIKSIETDLNINAKLYSLAKQFA